MPKSNGSAVDEGRNPYGKPTKDKSNWHDGYTIFLDTPCTICRSAKKRMTVVGNEMTIYCERNNGAEVTD